MKIAQDLCKYTAEQDIGREDALKNETGEKSKEFCGEGREGVSRFS